MFLISIPSYQVLIIVSFDNDYYYHNIEVFCTLALLWRQLDDRRNDELAWPAAILSNGSWCDAAPPMIFGLNRSFREKIFLNDNGISRVARTRCWTTCARTALTAHTHSDEWFFTIWTRQKTFANGFCFRKQFIKKKKKQNSLDWKRFENKTEIM